MARQTFQLQGMKELEKNLGELPRATGKAVLRRVAKKALGIFDQAWREKAPHLTGALEESGGVSTKLTRRQARINRKRDDRASIEMYAGPNDPAAIPEEFGWVDGAAQPFVRPSWDQTRVPVLDSVTSQLGTEIERSARRLARKAAKRG